MATTNITYEHKFVYSGEYVKVMKNRIKLFINYELLRCHTYSAIYFCVTKSAILFLISLINVIMYLNF